MTKLAPRSRATLTAALFASTVLVSGMVTPAHAQNAPSEAPLDGSAIDVNGVDLASGEVSVEWSFEESINKDHRLSMTRSFSNKNWYDITTPAIYEDYSGTVVKTVVAIGGKTNKFTLLNTTFNSSNGAYYRTYTNLEGDGATLTSEQIFVSIGYTYRTSSGDEYMFTKRGASSAIADITYVKFADGEKLHYRPGAATYTDPFSGDPEPPSVTIERLSRIDSSTGYSLLLQHASPNLDPNYPDPESWSKIVGAVLTNKAVDPCWDWQLLESCSFSQQWPNVSFGTSSPYQPEETVVDTLGRTKRYTQDSSGRLIGIRMPGDTSNRYSFSYVGTTEKVASVVTPDGTWSYSYSDSGNIRTTTVTNPQAQQTVVTSDISLGKVLTYKDPLNRITSYQPDTLGRTLRRTYPEGNYTQFTYDSRGNITQVVNVPKAGSGGVNITTSASYDATCVDFKKCNKPNSTTDAKGNVTDYTYDPAHGGVLTITLPPATVGGIRPQTRYSYSPLQAYIKNTVGGFSPIVPANQIYKVTSISTCSASASCAGSAGETKTAFSYGSLGVANNLHRTRTVVSSGNNAISSSVDTTYSSVGDPLTVDGPLPGAADTTRFRYNAARELVGVVTPDPDGSGPRQLMAQRLTYNAQGNVVLTEIGTVASQSDAHWAGMTVSQSTSNSYDAMERAVEQRNSASGNIYGIAQTKYDSLGRVDCTAVRMDPTQWSSQTDACIPQTSGANGPDRITKTIYDTAGQVVKVRTAVGTAQQSDEITQTYTLNGKVATVTDGENNRTTYEYDGHDRLSKTRYPVGTLGAASSSTTDFEQLTYDANSNITQRRLRDGQLVNFTLDNLNRVTVKDLPAPDNDATFTYDLLGRQISIFHNGQVLTKAYDALSRVTSDVGVLGTNSYGYDAAGRRTSFTYPNGGLTINYDYDVTDNITAIRENGATSGIGVLATYAYDNLGRRTSITRGNGAVTSFAFDPVSRMSQMVQNPSGTAQDLTLDFSYNPASQIGSNTRSNDSYAWGSHYNVNRSYGTNGLNQLTSAGPTALTYDGRGNLIASGASAYTYTVENLLRTAPGGVAPDYDPAMRLLAIRQGSATNVKFGYDGADLIAEYNSSNSLLRRYVHGPGSDEPLVWYEGSALTDRRFLHSDERGSVIAISNGSGAVTNINRYDEYGIPASTNVGRFQYTGQTWLPEIGMYYYKARIYSPTLGRFMQTDPIGYADGINWYDYVGGDPVNGRDPTGAVGEGADEAVADSDIVVPGKRIRPPRVPTRPISPLATPANFQDSFTAYQNGAVWACILDDTECRARNAALDEIAGFDKKPGKSKEPESKKSLTDCFFAFGEGFVDGFFDPEGAVLAIGGAAWHAANRTAREDYRPLSNEERAQPRNSGTLRRSYGSALRIGAKRAIPGYLAISTVVGTVKGVIAASNDPNCKM
jgi:RHS repeat-associated protein